MCFDAGLGRRRQVDRIEIRAKCFATKLTAGRIDKVKMNNSDSDSDESDNGDEFMMGGSPLQEEEAAASRNGNAISFYRLIVQGWNQKHLCLVNLSL